VAKTVLTVTGRFEDKGWGNPISGIEYFNNHVSTPFGLLGKLQVEFEDGYPVILRADEVVLIRRGFPHEWTTPTTGVSVEDNPFGFKLFDLVGKNGMVRYRLIDDELEWAEQLELPDYLEPMRLEKWQLGQRTYEKWTPVKDAPAEIFNTIDTILIQEAT
jgi:hypothetical protein